MICKDCTKAAAEEWHGFADNCRGCVGRGLARIFLAKGERGRKFRMACEQANITEQQAREAWKGDAMNEEKHNAPR